MDIQMTIISCQLSKVIKCRELQICVTCALNCLDKPLSLSQLLFSYLKGGANTIHLARWLKGQTR